MVVLRLRREGTTKRPTYRVVATDSRNPRDGRFLQMVGHYNPRGSLPVLVLNEEAILSWLDKGAQPSDTVVKLMKKQGLYRRWLEKKLGPLALKKEEKDEVKAATAKAEEAKPAKKPTPKAKPRPEKGKKKARK